MVKSSQKVWKSLQKLLGGGEALVGEVAVEECLGVAVGFFDEVPGVILEDAGVVDSGREEFGGEDKDIALAGVAEEAEHGAGPEEAEMGEVIDALGHEWFGMNGFDRGLHKAGGGDASVNKADAIEDGLKEVHFGVEIAVDHLLAAVEVAEIAIEADIGKALCELDSAPHILGDGGAMGFNESGELVKLNRIEDRAKEGVDGRVILHTPADVQGQAQFIVIDMLTEDGIGFSGMVNAIEATEGKGWRRRDCGGFAIELDPMEAVCGEAGDGIVAGEVWPDGGCGQGGEVAGIEKDAELGRIVGLVI